MLEHTADFYTNGFTVVTGVIDSDACDRIASQSTTLASSYPGTRTVLSAQWCVSLVDELRANHAVRALLPDEPKAVQCTYFEKSESQNWLVPLHQDLSIPVQERIDADSCSAWSVKEGVTFVQPPTSVLDKLVAVRLHLDDSILANGPLRVVRGSHQRGRLTSAEAKSLRHASGEVVCLCPKGGVLVMRPLLLHASSKATVSAFRRVLHFVFGPRELPYGLRWHTSV